MAQAREGIPLHLEVGAAVLEAAEIPLAPWRRVSDTQYAKEAVEALEPPLVMKIDSPQISHKSDVGGVVTGLRGVDAVVTAHKEMVARVAETRPEAEVRGVTLHEQVSGVELVLGMIRDPQFGPVVMVGLGGVFVEVLEDLSFRVAPFDSGEARAALDELRGAQLLDGFRGGARVDRGAVAQAMVSLGETALALPQLEEVDLNPVMASESGVLVADVRMVKKGRG